MEKKKTLVKNTFILFVSVCVSKILGAALKIPLANMLGGIGMSYYSAAYSFFLPIYAFIGAGIPIVMTKTVSMYAAQKKYRDIHKIKYTALTIFACAGICGSLLLSLISFFAFGDMEARLPLLLIAPSLVICCVAAVYKGYYEGLSNMFPTALSQIVESIAKTVVGLGLSYVALKYFTEQLGDYDKAVPYGAAGAILGITLSELAGLIFLIIRNGFGDGINRENKSKSPQPMRFRQYGKKLLFETLPISVSAVIINLTSFIDVLTISPITELNLNNNSSYYLKTFIYGVTPEISADKLGDFFYGSFSGIAITVFMLIPAIIGIFTRSSLPGIAASTACGNKHYMKRDISLLLKSTVYTGAPIYFGLMFLSRHCLEFLYPLRTQEVCISVTPLILLCAGGLFLSLTSCYISVFQALNRSDLPIKIMLFSAAVKLLSNLFLISIPEINLNGAAIGTDLSYLASTVLSCVALNKCCGIKISVLPILVPPVIIALCASFCGYLSTLFLPQGSLFLTIIIDVLITAIIYTVFLSISEFRNIKRFILKKNP